jgi:hypothetical protein
MTIVLNSNYLSPDLKNLSAEENMLRPYYHAQTTCFYPADSVSAKNLDISMILLTAN